MKKRLLAWPGLLLCLLLPLMAACGNNFPQQSNNASTHQAETTVNNELYVLDSYTGFGQSAGTRHIVALPVGTANSTARLTLPAGLTDLKHQWLYFASPASDGSANTTISVLDTLSGASIRTFSIAGHYTTADQGLADSMLSGNGQWLALREQNAPAGTTEIALIDTLAGKQVKSIQLKGNFALDALSPAGTMLYLLEYYEARTTHYNVRAYNVPNNFLYTGNIVDKNDLNEQMNGNYLTRWMSAGGNMAYTLYINPVLNKAFIHILFLAEASNQTFPLLARCIDLPVGQSPALLKYYTLSLAQDGNTLYAANAALGSVAAVNLNLGLNVGQLWLILNAKTAHFTPDTGAASGTDQTRALYHGSVLSRDQQLLYVAGIHGIQIINVASLQLQGEYLKPQSFTGLAISGDGHTLYAVDPTSGITLLNTANGQVNGTIRSSIQAPWGIAWTTF
ncbi:MAG TPA: hypothetical protein VGD98_05790 [Ktedonobacteraceae bacterium]